MTQSKRNSIERSSGWWDIFNQHSDRAIKACTWILVAMCVALIVITVFMANPRMKSVQVLDTHLTLLEDRRLVEFADDFGTCVCQQEDSTVKCTNTSLVYSDVFQALQEAPDGKDVRLEIINQGFPRSMLQNKWIPTNKSVSELVIKNGNFTIIANEAFNSKDYTQTQDLTLDEIDVTALSNGVLLGLSDLRSLVIKGKVGSIGRCFFQPVQSTLGKVEISVGLKIAGEENIFGISHMPLVEAINFSDNVISGPLSRSFFMPVPNVRCVMLANTKLTSIAEDAFDDIAANLHILNLSNNYLTALDVGSMERILAFGRVNLYLLGNDWHCNCDLKPLIDLYMAYYDRFADIPYCNKPLALYGVLFVNVTFGIECDGKVDEDSTKTSTSVSVLTDIPSLTTFVSVPPMEVTSTVASEMSSFHMKCLTSVIDTTSSADESSSSEQVEDYRFAPPCHEFEVVLMANGSAQVVVQAADDPINIVWFSDAVENFVYTIESLTVDYNCELYTEPYLIIDNLLQNSTYTFCLVPNGMYSITPFNCLPLHVPIREEDDNIIWISTEEKQFTVGIVCLIFCCSMLLGGAIAYFGIKAYPDVLEGSRHVLVVKKSDQACYVSTITDGEYNIKSQLSQKGSLKKKGSFTKCTENKTLV